MARLASSFSVGPILPFPSHRYSDLFAPSRELALNVVCTNFMSCAMLGPAWLPLDVKVFYSLLACSSLRTRSLSPTRHLAQQLPQSMCVTPRRVCCPFSSLINAASLLYVGCNSPGFFEKFDGLRHSILPTWSDSGVLGGLIQLRGQTGTRLG